MMQGVFQPPVKFQYQKEKNSRFWAVKKALCILNKIGIGLHQSYDDPDFELQIVFFLITFTDNFKKIQIRCFCWLTNFTTRKINKKTNFSSISTFILASLHWVACVACKELHNSQTWLRNRESSGGAGTESEGSDICL